MARRRAFATLAPMEVRNQSLTLCALALRANREAVCPGAECSLWENGGCALERLTAAGELDGDSGPAEA
jgi:hypothetical protein